MNTEISQQDIERLVERQLGSLFMYDERTESEIIRNGVERSLSDCETCFAGTTNKYYQRDGDVYFNPFHSGQYSIFLYYLSRAVWRARSGPSSTLADRIYYLNKCLNGLDLFYQVSMPSVFFLDHPIGSVMGRADYGERFSFTQNCTVGNNHGLYPIIGDNVAMKSGSKIVGGCRIGDDVTIAANAYVKDEDIPGDSLVFGSSPGLVIKPRRR